MDNIVGLKELRENISTYADRVKRGQSFIVVKRSKPLFKISPFDEEDGLWEELIDFTKIKRGGVPIRDVLARL